MIRLTCFIIGRVSSLTVNAAKDLFYLTLVSSALFFFKIGNDNME
jgi:hypothetical protein